MDVIKFVVCFSGDWCIMKRTSVQGNCTAVMDLDLNVLLMGLFGDRADMNILTCMVNTSLIE